MMPKRWKLHFDEHLNGVQTENHSSEESDSVGATNEGEVSVPTIGEVKDPIKQLEKMGLERSLLRWATYLHQVGQLYASMFIKIWDTEQLPEEWKDGVIWPIYKKGDKLDSENYRAITVLNAAYKVFSLVIFRRLSPLANRFVGSYQAGFVEGRSTTDKIFTLRQIPMHHLFIDYKAAYDTINRNELWKIMDENGFPGKLTRLIKATMNGMQCYVRI